MFWSMRLEIFRGSCHMWPSQASCVEQKIILSPVVREDPAVLCQVSWAEFFILWESSPTVIINRIQRRHPQSHEPPGLKCVWIRLANTHFPLRTNLWSQTWAFNTLPSWALVLSASLTLVGVHGAWILTVLFYSLLTDWHFPPLCSCLVSLFFMSFLFILVCMTLESMNRVCMKWHTAWDAFWPSLEHRSSIWHYLLMVNATWFLD